MCCQPPRSRRTIQICTDPMSLYYVALCPTFTRENREICSMVVEQSLLSQVDVPLFAWVSLEEMGFLQDDLPILSRLRPYMVSHFYLSILVFRSFVSFLFGFCLLRGICAGAKWENKHIISLCFEANNIISTYHMDICVLKASIPVTSKSIVIKTITFLSGS